MFVKQNFYLKLSALCLKADDALENAVRGV